MCEPSCSDLQLDKRIYRDSRRRKEAIGGVLSQDEYPVIQGSRILSHVKQDYSKIEGEELAIVSMVTRLKKTLLRRAFTLQTDHKSDAPEKEIPRTDGIWLRI